MTDQAREEHERSAKVLIQGEDQLGMTASDFEGIRQLFARYSQTLDLGDVEGFTSCFTEGGALDTSAPEAGMAGVHQGREQLRAFAVAANEYTVGRVRHSALNLLIDGDGTTARASSYVIVTRAYADATNAHGQASHVTYATLETTGMFFDDLVKVDGRWLFAHRQFRHDGLPEVLDRVDKTVTIGRNDALPERMGRAAAGLLGRAGGSTGSEPDG